MNTTSLPISNTSYTNRDFQTIFPELLQTVGKLTTKWNPLSEDTNESDPGVVLIKLLALIGDKLNYNVDKNVLECFPLSVTQEGNARQLYSQLGYNMRWYRSATTDIYIKYLGETIPDFSYKIPLFTMISDESNSIVYTLLGDSDLSSEDKFDFSEKAFPFDGTTVAYKAIQGIAIQYEINGQSTIQPYHLDSNNRLYFNTRNVAENGIFITNVSSEGTNYDQWERKDNLLLEKLNHNYYSFGVTKDGASCYIEFPEDAENIFKEGINITYIRTAGQDGNVPSETLEKFYADITVNDDAGNPIVLNMDTVRVWNPYSTSNGQNPESINDAIRNFKKLTGTFNTLITLRDYRNYVSSKGKDFEVSNGFVCDRTNDIQCVYNVMMSDNQVSTQIPKVEQISSTTNFVKNADGTYTPQKNPSLTAFDLKFYLLQRPISISSQSDFNTTFQMKRFGSDIYNDLSPMQVAIEDIKAIPHDYCYLSSSDANNAHVCMILNKYPVVCKIQTRQKYTESVENEIREKIRQQLFSNLNSQQLDFSYAVTADDIKQLILSSDNRIKDVVVNDLKYQTYAVYWDGSKYHEAILNGDNIEESDLYCSIRYSQEDPQEEDPLKPKYKGDYETTGVRYTAGDIVLFPVVDATKRDYASYIDNYPQYDHQSRWRCKKSEISAPAGLFKLRDWEEIPIEVVVSDTDQLQYTLMNATIVNGKQQGQNAFNNYEALSFTKNENGWKLDKKFEDAESNEIIKWRIIVNNEELFFDNNSVYQEEDLRNIFGIQISSEDYRVVNGDKITFGPSKSLQIRDEIWAKSALSGTTSLYQKDEEFDYTYNQVLESKHYPDGIYRGIKSVATFNERTIKDKETVTLRDGESLQFLTPNLIDWKKYSNYVKIGYHLEQNAQKDVSRQLLDKEWIALFWKSADEDTVYTYDILYGSSPDADANTQKYWFMPTFQMLKGTNLPDGSNSITSFITSAKDKTGNTNYASTATTSPLSLEASSEVETLMNSKTYILSGTKSLSIKKRNSFSIDSTFYCYWILNNKKKGKYYLFEKTPQSDKDQEKGVKTFQEYTLGTGEYFFYLKGSLTQIGVLGSGTTIRRTMKSDTGFDNDWVVSSEATLDRIMELGAKALQGVWFQPSSTEDVNIIENKYATLGPGTKVKITMNGKTSATISSELTEIETLFGSQPTIEYVDTTNTEQTATMTNLNTLIDNLSDAKVRLLLSLNISSYERQILYSGQKVILYDSDDEAMPEIIGKDEVGRTSTTPAYYPVVIQSSVPLSMDGTSKYNTSIVDEDGNITYSNLYLYQEWKSDSSVIYSSDGKVVATISNVTGSTTDSSVQFEFKIPATNGTQGTNNWSGQYLIKLNTSSTMLRNLKVQFNGENVADLHGLTEFSQQNNDGKSIYFKIWMPNQKANSTIKVLLSSKENEGTVNVTLSNPFRFRPNSTITYNAFNKYEKLVQELDYDGQYDYTYQADTNKAIKNPLDAMQFFNQNHIFYEYTISQMGTLMNDDMVIVGEN